MKPRTVFGRAPRTKLIRRQLAVHVAGSCAHHRFAAVKISSKSGCHPPLHPRESRIAVFGENGHPFWIFLFLSSDANMDEIELAIVRRVHQTDHGECRRPIGQIQNGALTAGGGRCVS